ncbi:hypothetical protein R9C00_25670 [Flammeovirgaceae bacterium SG7u.111]|nr:hypothetical protein [Flammeovirgaceae bacterium SG7u.132]WPO35087.1 hypothetical protein R9C00_25670 [Flammeovirgaceae bacterium SG7u.111]
MRGSRTRSKASGKVAWGDPRTEVIGPPKRPDCGICTDIPENGSSKGHHEVRNWIQRLSELGVPAG